MHFPPLYRIQQRFDVVSIDDVAQAVRDEFARFAPETKICPGQRVAVGVGSRGTHELKILVATVVECLRALQLEPYIIPAMGSHGGATGGGQAQVLAELGITEQSVGAPIVSNMDVISLGCVESGAEVFFAKDALAADHVVVINRVKPHTAFRAEVESGLCKILAVGCGKRQVSFRNGSESLTGSARGSPGSDCQHRIFRHILGFRISVARAAQARKYQSR